MEFWLKKSHTYQTREVQEPEKTIINSEKGERWNGKDVGAERRGSEPTHTDTRSETLMLGKKTAPTQKIGSAGCGSGVEGTGERAHPSRCPARRGHNRNGTKPQVKMVNLYKC